MGNKVENQSGLWGIRMNTILLILILGMLIFRNFTDRLKFEGILEGGSHYQTTSHDHDGVIIDTPFFMKNCTSLNQDYKLIEITSSHLGVAWVLDRANKFKTGDKVKFDHGGRNTIENLIATNVRKK